MPVHDSLSSELNSALRLAKPRTLARKKTQITIQAVGTSGRVDARQEPEHGSEWMLITCTKILSQVQSHDLGKGSVAK